MNTNPKTPPCTLSSSLTVRGLSTQPRLTWTHEPPGSVSHMRGLWYTAHAHSCLSLQSTQSQSLWHESLEKTLSLGENIFELSLEIKQEMNSAMFYPGQRQEQAQGSEMKRTRGAHKNRRGKRKGASRWREGGWRMIACTHKRTALRCCPTLFLKAPSTEIIIYVHIPESNSGNPDFFFSYISISRKRVKLLG